MNQAKDYMIQLKSCIVSLFIIWLLIGKIYCQNILDLSHSKEFAQYLMQSGQFPLAASEWERVLFLSPCDTSARLNLIKSLRLSEKLDDAMNKMNYWYPSGPLPRSLSLEAIQLALKLHDYKSFNSIIERAHELYPFEKSNLKLGAWLMEGTWINSVGKTRESFCETILYDEQLLDLYDKTKIIHRKSPTASMAMSAVIPGLGKIYTHDWRDGLISLLFVAVNAWQSYQGFSKNGIRSVTGWVFGGLTVGFYSANLFGSWKAAMTYNSRQINRIRLEAENILFTQ